MLKLQPSASVPCGSCRLCCQRTAVMLVDGVDQIAEYETTEEHGARFLCLQPNGDCVYLGPDGCTIHERAPYMCRIFDCRAQHAQYTREERRDLVKRGLLNAEILKRGAMLRRAA